MPIDPLSEPKRLTTNELPVITTGVRRSGSSLLSHVLSDIDEWYIFDDLSPREKAMAYGLAKKPALSEAEIRTYCGRLAVVTRVRLTMERRFAPPAIELHEIEVMEETVVQLMIDHDGDVAWTDLLREWNHRLVLLDGGTQWGFHSGNAFMHLDELAIEFPGFYLICLQRNPLGVMRSYKNVTRESNDGDPERYHPVAYAIYWRMAYRSMAAHIERHPDTSLWLTFEELIADPLVVARKAAALTGATPPTSVEVPEANTSLLGEVRELTPTEMWICTKLAGPEMIASGYELPKVRPRIRDLGELASVSWTFGKFQVKEVLGTKESRAKLKRTVNRMLGR